VDPITSIKLSSAGTARFWEIPVLYSDEHLLALDKPVDLAVTPEPRVLEKEAPTSLHSLLKERARDSEGDSALLPLLHDAIKQGKSWARALNLSFLVNAHRLDPEVSGVLLFARSKAVLTTLNDLFGSEKPTLRFLALVQGNPDRDQFEQDVPLLPVPDPGGRYRVNRRDGKRARSGFRVIERFSGYALLVGEPFTHRPHQLRAHLSKLGFPLAGDTLYGGEPLLLSRIKRKFHLKPGHNQRPLLGRPALHAQTLTITHPVTGQPLTITAPLPHDFEAALKYLRRYCGQPPVLPAPEPAPAPVGEEGMGAPD